MSYRSYLEKFPERLIVPNAFHNWLKSDMEVMSVLFATTKFPLMLVRSGRLRSVNSMLLLTTKSPAMTVSAGAAKSLVEQFDIVMPEIVVEESEGMSMWPALPIVMAPAVFKSGRDICADGPLLKISNELLPHDRPVRLMLLSCRLSVIHIRSGRE